MNSQTIREKFLNFFKEKGHQIVPSAPIVVKNDPTLMFTNAGMNQFKDYFLGNEQPSSVRVADTQRCLRVSGKHNDLEEVGHDTYHHTMFEMLGNWSFGDYFKEEAIEWAWELLTVVYGLDKERLYVSVFGGDKGDHLEPDSDALTYWKKIVPESRILYGSKKDNFWEMGDTGPCGPCSEIHIDLRSDADRKKINGKDLVNQDHPQVVEIWNLVFMEFNRTENGSLVPLPAKHIDTGMGFERLCMAIQGKMSNYETDVFLPLINKIAADANTSYGSSEKSDIALRVIADHLRAVSFAIADGQLPSNTGGGYVIRRILRRAVRYGFTFLGLKQPFLNSYVAFLANQFKGVFDELEGQLNFVQRVIEEEEISFLRTLEKGLSRLNVLKADLDAKNEKVISGEVAFELYDTFGFPFDLTRLIASENQLTVDEQGFLDEMAKQKSRSKKDAQKETGDWVIIAPGETEFVGYDQTEVPCKILRYRTLLAKGKEQYQLVLDVTPFYGESGGQVGDKGMLINGSQEIAIVDTQKENNLIVHQVNKLPVDASGNWNAKVAVSRRQDIMNNHSATHLLHAALRQVLGTHVEQRGSLVNDQLLRFDFSHFSKVTEEEILKIETIVNNKIRQNIPLDERRQVPIEEAKMMGATALFGEKYGDYVRVITFDESYSRELCGGTHVKATGNIGFFKITSESSIAAGIRRIEAITGNGAEKLVREQSQLIQSVAELLKSNKLVDAVNNLLEQKSQLEKQLDELKQKESQQVKQTLVQHAILKDNIHYVIAKVALPDANSLKQLCYDIRNQLDQVVIVLAANIADKPQLGIMFADNLINDERNAGKLIRELAVFIKGGGGGQPFFATAGGKDLSGLDQVVVEAKKRFEIE